MVIAVIVIIGVVSTDSDIDSDYFAEDLDLFGDIILPPKQAGNTSHQVSQPVCPPPPALFADNTGYPSNISEYTSQAYHNARSHSYQGMMRNDPLALWQNLHQFPTTRRLDQSAESNSFDQSASSVSDCNIAGGSESDMDADDEDEEGGGAENSADVGYIRIHSQDDDGNGVLFPYYSPDNTDSSCYNDSDGEDSVIHPGYHPHHLHDLCEYAFLVCTPFWCML